MRQLRTLGISLLGSVGLCLLAAGCAAEKHEAIPPDAQLTAKGEKDLTYRATNDGKVFVYDRSNGEMLYTGNLRQGELISVDAIAQALRRAIDDPTLRARCEREGPVWAEGFTWTRTAQGLLPACHEAAP